MTMPRNVSPGILLVRALTMFEALTMALVLAFGLPEFFTSPRTGVAWSLAPREWWAVVFALVAVLAVVGVYHRGAGQVSLALITMLWAGWTTAYTVGYVLAPIAPFLLLALIYLTTWHLIIAIVPAPRQGAHGGS